MKTRLVEVSARVDREVREIGGIMIVHVREQVGDGSVDGSVMDQVSSHVWMQVSNRVYDLVENPMRRRSMNSL
jgi:hypothetical protein